MKHPFKRLLMITTMAICLSPAWTWAQPHAQSEASKPNIIILYADDMGYGDLAIQNPQSKIPTPNLDRLAQEGMRFTDGHSSSGICTPSRYALLTGRYHWRDFHGIVNKMEGGSFFKPGQHTLPKMLQAQGYATAAIGKWHLGWGFDKLLKPGAEKTNANGKSFYGHEAFDWDQPIPDGPLSVGFDHYFGDDVINFPPYAWLEDDRILTPPTANISTPTVARIEGNWEARPGPASEGWDFFKVLPTITEKAADYIEKRKDQDQPFFLYFAFPSPHAPIIPNDEFVGKSDAGLYGDFVYQTDWCVGQILAALDRAGLSDDTLVIFSSDNGPEKYAYLRQQKHGHWSSEPLRGLKRDLYEGGHRVPFIVKWPGHVPAGTANNQVISQVDLIQTLATLTGASLPPNSAHDSHDFAENWQQTPSDAAPPIRAATIQNTRRNAYAIRMGSWVLIDSPTGHHSKDKALQEFDAEHKQGQLFDLGQDPGQTNNLYDQYPGQVTTMRDRLNQIREQGHSAPRLSHD